MIEWNWDETKNANEKKENQFTKMVCCRLVRHSPDWYAYRGDRSATTKQTVAKCTVRIMRNVYWNTAVRSLEIYSINKTPRDVRRWIASFRAGKYLQRPKLLKWKWIFTVFIYIDCVMKWGKRCFVCCIWNNKCVVRIARYLRPNCMSAQRHFRSKNSLTIYSVQCLRTGQWKWSHLIQHVEKCGRILCSIIVY